MMPSRSKGMVLSGVSLVFGAVVWAVIAHVSGKREAWDSGVYFRVGLPVCYAASGIVGYVKPRRSWRWGVLPFAGQLLWMIVSTREIGSLMPLGAVLMGVLSLPGVFLAIVGAALAKGKR